MRPRPRILVALQRLVLRTGRTPVRRLWALLYEAVARAASAYLTRGETGAATYVRGGDEDDFLPGLSDVDLAIVLQEDPRGPGVAGERVRRRWARLDALPLNDLVLDWPRIHEEPELRDLGRTSALTHGIDRRGQSDPGGAGYFGSRASLGVARRGQRGRRGGGLSHPRRAGPTRPDPVSIISPGSD